MNRDSINTAWEHFRAIIWLRWRLSYNHTRRAGQLNAVLMAIGYVLRFVLALVAFALCFGLGLALLGRVEADYRMILWDALVVGFLAFWLGGLMTELQRDDSLSLENLLHYPLSLSSAFVLNYVISLDSLGLLLFVPAAVGLALASLIVDGSAAVVLLLLVLTFTLMVTAVGYQFRGWMTNLMLNKRRRRAILSAMFVVFMLIVQAPNLINMLVIQPSIYGDSTSEGGQEMARILAEIDKLRAQQNRLIALAGQTGSAANHASGDATGQKLAEVQFRINELSTQLNQFHQQASERKAQSLAATWKITLEVLAWVNAIVPLGWLPYGARALKQGMWWPALLSVVGMGSIAAWSLRQSYAGTIRFYTGAISAGKNRRKVSDTAAGKPAKAATALADQPGIRFVEWRLKPLPDRAAAVALANFSHLSRAPAVRAIVIAPLLLFLFGFGGMLLNANVSVVPVPARPFLGLGAIACFLLGGVALLVNQYGYDGHGFRIYLLSPIPREQIVLGKNLSLAVFFFGGAMLFLLALQFVLPMQLGALLALVLHIAAVYLLACMIGNPVSILFPIGTVPGKQARPHLVAVIVQLIAFCGMAFVLLPSAVCLGVGGLLHWLGYSFYGLENVALAVPLLAGVVFAYRFSLRVTGRLLQRHELRMLDKVVRRDD